MRVGIEIEAENIPDPFNIDDGVWEHDGSLRNNGIEYISEVLIDVQTGKDWHEGVISRLNEEYAIYSSRCGVHIHMDFSDKLSSPEPVKKFVRNYLLMERYIVSLLPETRRKSTFCLPLLDYDGDYYAIKMYLQRQSLTALSGCSKYSALNLQPLARQGSIEFRMLPTLGDVSLFNQVIDILEDCYEKEADDIIETYALSEKDVLEAEAYYKNLTSTQRDGDGNDYLSTHFHVEQPRQQSNSSSGITQEMLETYLQEIA